MPLPTAVGSGGSPSRQWTGVPGGEAAGDTAADAPANDARSTRNSPREPPARTSATDRDLVPGRGPVGTIPANPRSCSPWLRALFLRSIPTSKVPGGRTRPGGTKVWMRPIQTPSRSMARSSQPSSRRPERWSRALKPASWGEFGDDHGIRRHHGPPFLINLARLQRPEQQPRSADPDLLDTCFRVQPILRIHGPKITPAMASREALTESPTDLIAVVKPRATGSASRPGRSPARCGTRAPGGGRRRRCAAPAPPRKALS